MRHELRPEETLDNAEKYVKLFLGNCFGVGLHKRGRSDSHICFTLLVEDDEHWFPSRSGGSSSWLPDVIEVMTAAHYWCNGHAVPDIHNGQCYGWRFPEGAVNG